MNGCIYRTRSDLCMKFTTEQSISFCVGKKCPDRKESNADRIRSMTDEELAEWASIREMCFIYHLLINDPDLRNKCRIYENCKDCWLEWLKQEGE